MTFVELKQYAEDLGVRWEEYQHDGGRSVTLFGAGRVGRFNYAWGEETRFQGLVKHWLDAHPWPGEDDPRIIREGVYE